MSSNPFELIESRIDRLEAILCRIDEKLPDHYQTQPTDPERWFNLQEFCEYHPDRPTPATVYGWVNSGLVPVHKTQKRLRFLKSEIDAWLKTGRRRTLAESAHEAESYINRKTGTK